MVAMSPIFVCLVVLGVPALVLFAIAILAASRSGKDKGSSAEEVAMIEEMYRGFQKMEDRIQAIETILLDRVERK